MPRQAHKKRRPAPRGARGAAGERRGLQVACAKVRLPEGDGRWLRRYGTLLARAVGLGGAQISVALVGDGVMRRLHRRYLGSAATTDVLTFDLADPGDSSRQAEIVICVAQARRVARRLGHAVRLELLLYLLHGLLHLRGYDDASAPQARRMHQRENELLRKVGLPAVSVTAGGLTG